MNEMQVAVQKMHEMFGHPVAETPTLVDEETAYLRWKLISEELEEYRAACLTGDLVEIADALGDLLVVVFGSAAVHGIDMKPVFDLIMLSQESKLDENGEPIISRGMELDGKPKGKFMKGPNYWEPQPKIALELKRQSEWFEYDGENREELLTWMRERGGKVGTNSAEDATMLHVEVFGRPSLFLDPGDKVIVNVDGDFVHRYEYDYQPDWC